MKFTIPKKDLARIVGLVSKLAPSKPAQPAIGCVLIEARDVVSVSATDLYVGANATSSAKVTKPGAILAPARLLEAAVKGLADGEVTVTLDGARLELKSGKSVQRIAHADAADFPKLATCPDIANEILAHAFLAALAAVSHSMSADDARPYLKGALVEFGNGRCRAVATDGHTLSRLDVDCESDVVAAFLPPRAVVEIMRALAAAKEGSVGVAVHDGRIFVRSAGFVVDAAIADNGFPKGYEQIIPGKADHRAVVSREALLESIRRVAPAVDETTLSVGVTLSNGTLRLMAESKDGSASDELDVDYAGAGLDVKVRGAYLAACVSSLTCDDVAIEICDGDMRPVLLVPVGGRDAIQIVMPTR